MEEKQVKRTEQITIETAIKYAKASVYALRNNAKDITPKEIEKEMMIHYERYNDKMIPMIIRAYEQEEKKK